MKEMIVRITDVSTDVDLLFNSLAKNEVFEKNLSLDKFLEILQNNLIKENNKKNDQKIKCDVVENGVIGFGSNKNNKKYIIKQPEHQRYITYSVGKDNKVYKINFPSSIYCVFVRNNNIDHIEAYMYFEDNQLNTQLYAYGMPNMLSKNSICIGNAKREIYTSLMQTLEEIIYAPYSHAELNNVKAFRTTKSYFEYLQKNHIQKKHLYQSKKILKDLYQ